MLKVAQLPRIKLATVRNNLAKYEQLEFVIKIDSFVFEGLWYLQRVLVYILSNSHTIR